MIHNAACLKEKLRADVFTAAFFGSKSPENSKNVPTNVDLSAPNRGETVLGPMKKYIQELADRYRFFHWHLAFPEIFELGGFDVVLGNPPWGRIKVSENDFFESRHPIIRNEKQKSNRESLIEKLNHPDAHDWEKKLYKDFLAAKHEVDATALFARCSGRFPLTAYGDLNLYPLFSELSLYLINSRGRCGIVVKTGIATDDGNKAFFEFIVRKQMLCRIVSFVEIRKIFRGAKSPDPFCLIVLSAEPETAELMFGLYNVSQISDHRRAFRMTYQDFVTVNPNTLTCPTFQSEGDASLVKKIYSSSGVFINEANNQNPWDARLHSMFHMSNDSHLFKTAMDFVSDGLRIEKSILYDTENNKWLPIMEAKLIHQFDHRWASFNIGAERARDTTLQEKQSRNFTSLPRYWIKSEEIENWKKVNEYDKPYVVCWRNNARVVLQRTLISSIIPLYGIGNSLSFITFPKETSPQLLVTLTANLNSIILDYVVRLKLAGPNLNFFFVKQFPVIPPNHYSEVDIAFIVPRALELIYTNHELNPLAKDLGYKGEPFPFIPERRLQLRCELDAYYARLYGLTRDELGYILDPTDVMGEDYPTETFRVLKNKEINEFGEYQTRGLVLAAWDELSAAETVKKTAPIAEFSLYPETDSDRAICAIALALVHQTGGMCSMDHLDALILAVRPELCRIFLSKSDQHSLDTAMASAPKILWSDNRLNIHWKECRDHLEARKAIYIRHGLKDQPIEVGSEFSTVQASFPRHVEKIALVALNALAKVNELRKSRAAVTSEQAKSLSIFEDQHRAYQLVA